MQSCASRLIFYLLLSLGDVAFLPDAALPPVALMLPAEAPVEPLVVTPELGCVRPAMSPPIEPLTASLFEALEAGEPGADEPDVPLAEAPPLCVCAKAAPLPASITAKEVEKIKLRMRNS